MTSFIPSVTTMLQANTMDLTNLLTLRQALERFRLLVENANDLVAEITPDGQIVYISPNVRTVLGFSPRELAHQNVFDYVHSDEHSDLRTHLASAESLATYRFRHTNDSWRSLETSSRAFFTPAGEKHRVLIGRDVTDRKTAEEACLDQTRKLETVGTFAGGVADELNSILSAVQAFTDLEGVATRSGVDTQGCREQAIKACHRARELVQQIRDCVRSLPSHPPVRDSSLINS